MKLDDRSPNHARARSVAVAVVVAMVTVLVGAQPSSAASTESIVTVAGTGVLGDTGDGGPATEAAINRPRSIFPTPDGGYVFAEPYSHQIRKVNADGIITTVAGTGTSGAAGDGGQATAATLNFVHSASPTSDGGLLLADTLNHKIRKIDASGIITTVAGTGARGFNGDGRSATSARLNTPRGLVALDDGSFLIADSDNNRIRLVASNGTITTVAGNGTSGFAGDGGTATAARLARPFGVATTPEGGFLVVDTLNQRIRKVAPGGTITTVAGNGVSGFDGDDGSAVDASLASPHNVVAEGDGFIIADRLNERVRRVDGDGRISTIAGTGTAGFNGDGLAPEEAQLNAPKAVALTATGDLLIADEGNNRVRLVGTPVEPAGPAISAVQASNVSSTSATIEWMTDQGASSQVEYGATTAYGQATEVNPALSTLHTKALSGLQPATQYNYRVVSTNAAGRTSMSPNLTFTTASESIAGPVISLVKVNNFSSTSATIKWRTDQGASSQVEYGATTAYGQATEVNPALSTRHSRLLSGLQPATQYNYRVVSTNAAGGTSTSANRTFTTAGAMGEPPPHG